MGYWSTINKINSGEPELIRSDRTNPEDRLGPACKHVLLVLSNTSWLIKVASVINNYIKYMERYRTAQYDKIIYPAIYKRNKPVQATMFDKEDEDRISDSDEEINATGSRLRRPRPVSVGTTKQTSSRHSLARDNNQITMDLSELDNDKVGGE